MLLRMSILMVLHNEYLLQVVQLFQVPFIMLLEMSILMV